MGNLKCHKSVVEQLRIGQRLLNSEKGHLLIEYKKSLYNIERSLKVLLKICRLLLSVNAIFQQLALLQSGGLVLGLLGAKMLLFRCFPCSITAAEA